jgi:uncharacterized protein
MGRSGKIARVSADLPTFIYHPDPVATGSVVPSEAPCPVCGLDRGFAYVGPVSAVDEVEDLCPWCIADGSAAAEFDAEFTDVDDAPSSVPETVVDEIAHRTPGFAGWQQERWMYHCGDGEAFLGRVGRQELDGLRPEAHEAIRNAASSVAPRGGAAAVLEALNAETSPTAYLFQCLHCRQYGTYIDFL